MERHAVVSKDTLNGIMRNIETQRRSHVSLILAISYSPLFVQESYTINLELYN